MKNTKITLHTLVFSITAFIIGPEYILGLPSPNLTGLSIVMSLRTLRPTEATISSSSIGLSISGQTLEVNITTVIISMSAAMVFVFCILCWKQYRNIQKLKKEAYQEKQRAELLITSLKDEVDQEKRKAEHLAASLKEATKELTDRIGYEVGNLEVQFDIKNTDGDCKLHYIYSDIMKTRPDAVVCRFPHKLRVSTAEGSFHSPPTLSRQSKLDGYDIETINSDPKMYEFQIKLRQGTKVSGYDYEAHLNRAFYMFQKETAEEKEWVGHHVDVAIKKLVIKVYFPPDYHVEDGDILIDVCNGWIPNEVSYSSEVDRIITYGLERRSSYISISIDKPLIGYLYLICWKPILKASLNLATQDIPPVKEAVTLPLPSTEIDPLTTNPLTLPEPL